MWFSPIVLSIVPMLYPANQPGLCRKSHQPTGDFIKMSMQYVTLPIWNPCRYILATIKTPVLTTPLVPTYWFAQDFHTLYFSVVLFKILLQVERLKDLSPHPTCHYPQRQWNPSVFCQQFSAAAFFFHYQISFLTFRKVFDWSYCSGLHTGKFSFAFTKNVLSLKDKTHGHFSIRTSFLVRYHASWISPRQCRRAGCLISACLCNRWTVAELRPYE